MAETATDLSLVSTDDLWEELSDRYDGCAMMATWRRTGKKEATQGFYKGGFVQAIGLLRIGLERLLQKDAASLEGADDPAVDP